MALFQPPRPAERILVIHTAFLGDIILATPFLAALRELYPAAQIHFLTTPGGAALLEPNPWRIVPLSYDKRGKQSGVSGFLAQARRLREFSPDLVFTLHRSIRSTLLAKAAGGEVWGFEEAVGSGLFRGRVSRKNLAYEAQKNLGLLQSFGDGKDFSPFPILQTSAADELEADRLLGGRKNFVVLAPSSVWATKRWPAERFGQLGARIQRELGMELVIVGGSAPEDQTAAAVLLEEFQRSGEETLPLNLTGSTGLGPLKSVLSRAKLVISNDSSPLHMAIAVKSKALGIFGPTTKELGFFPQATSGMAAVAELRGLECRPCGLHGHRSCPLGHFRCMLELEVNQVFLEAQKLLCP